MKAAKERGLMPSTGIGVGILASALLALLTLTVFYVLRDYGPESAIRKYNEAVINGDIVGLDQISTQPDSSPSGGWLHDQVRDFLAAGGRLHLDRMERNPAQNIDVASVRYVFPNQQVRGFLFVVTKQDHLWKVSPQMTEQALQRLLGNGE